MLRRRTSAFGRTCSARGARCPSGRVRAGSGLKRLRRPLAVLRVFPPYKLPFSPLALVWDAMRLVMLTESHGASLHRAYRRRRAPPPNRPDPARTRPEWRRATGALFPLGVGRGGCGRWVEEGWSCERGPGRLLRAVGEVVVVWVFVRLGWRLGERLGEELGGELGARCGGLAWWVEGVAGYGFGLGWAWAR